MMKLLSSAQKLITLLIMVAAAVACKQPETIVVDRRPDTAAQQDTTDKKPPTPQNIFQQLNIGENQPIHSLDPLLASNRSEYRAIQLIYDGLVRFNADGEIEPALAREWSSSSNNRKFTFHLRQDAYFHDSEVFGSGTGPKVTARNVSFVFERMARNTVPPRAAELFMNVKGFNGYFQEQRQVYNPKQRQLSGISGISTPNDTTVVFELNNPDPDFLKKLATPLAVIYPKEAVQGLESSFNPVGNGPFRFSQQANDSTFILAKFQDYYAASEIKLNRVDIISTDNEPSLWKAVKAQDIHYLPGLGPQLVEKLLTKQGSLKDPYTKQFTVSKNGQAKLTLYRNTGSHISENTGEAIAAIAEQNSQTLFSELGPGISDVTFSADNTKSATLSSLQLEIMKAEHPFEKQFQKNLASLLEKHGAKVRFSNISVLTDQTDLFVAQQDTLIPARSWTEKPTLFRFVLPIYSLTGNSIQNIQQNQYSWWISLRNTNLSDNLN